MRILFVALLAGALTAAALGADRLYVSSNFSHEVLRYDPDSGALLGVFVGAASGGLHQPHGILERDADILVCSFGTDQVLRYDRDSGAFVGALIGPASGLDDPVYLLPLPSGDLLVSSQGSDEVLRFDSAGGLIGAFVSAGSGGLNGPSGMAFGPDGRLYVAGRYSADVLAFDGTTGDFDEVLLDTTDGLTPGDTFGLQFSGDGALYVASNTAVHRFEFGAGAITRSTGFPFPIGLEIDDAGDILVADSNNLVRLDVDNMDAPSAPILTGGAINLLNFFHLVIDPAPASCPGDADSSGTVDFGDITSVLSNWLTDYSPGSGPGDANADGGVDFSDVTTVLSEWLSACP